MARLGSAAGPAPGAGRGPGPAPGTGSSAGSSARAGKTQAGRCDQVAAGRARRRGRAAPPARPAGGGDGWRAGAIGRRRAGPGAADGQLRGPAGGGGDGWRAGAIGRRGGAIGRERAGAIGRERAGAGRHRGRLAAERRTRCPRPAPASARRSAARPVGLGDRAGLGQPRRGVAGLLWQPGPIADRAAKARWSAPASGQRRASPPGPAPRSGPVSLSGPAPRSAPVSRSDRRLGRVRRLGQLRRPRPRIPWVRRVAAPPAVSGRAARVSSHRARFRPRTCRAAATFRRRRCLAGTCCARALPPRRRGGERRARKRHGGERRARKRHGGERRGRAHPPSRRGARRAERGRPPGGPAPVLAPSGAPEEVASLDLTSRQRQLVFALTVVALAGLGFFLLHSGIPGHRSAQATPASPGRRQLPGGAQPPRVACRDPDPDRPLLYHVIPGEHLPVAALHRAAARRGGRRGHRVLRRLRHLLLPRDRGGLHRPDAGPDHQRSLPR